jgi:hypothetical protein
MGRIDNTSRRDAKCRIARQLTQEHATDTETTASQSREGWK